MPAPATRAFIEERLHRAGPDWQHAAIFTPSVYRQAFSAVLVYYLELESIYFTQQDESLRANRLLWWQEEISSLADGTSAHPLGMALDRPGFDAIHSELRAMIRPPQERHLAAHLGSHLFAAVNLACDREIDQHTVDAGAHWGRMRHALIGGENTGSGLAAPSATALCPGLGVLCSLTWNRLSGNGELHPLRGLWLAWRAARQQA